MREATRYTPMSREYLEIHAAYLANALGAANTGRRLCERDLAEKDAAIDQAEAERDVALIKKDKERARADEAIAANHDLIAQRDEYREGCQAAWDLGIRLEYERDEAVAERDEALAALNDKVRVHDEWKDAFRTMEAERNTLREEATDFAPEDYLTNWRVRFEQVTARAADLEAQRDTALDILSAVRAALR